MVKKSRVVHVVYRFDMGGLENVIVQLINRMPPERFEHVVMSLTTVGDFAQRIDRPGVRVIALDKPPGHAIKLYPRIWRLLRELRPDVLHTCNIGPLEIVPVAALAGVRHRIHVEHGWDAADPNGSNRRYRFLRRLYAPFVTRFVSVSGDLDHYLKEAVGIADERRCLVGNGVDVHTFSPASRLQANDCPFVPGEHWIVGTVGRMMTVKNQPLLARAFVRLLRERPELAGRARLVMVGVGPLQTEVERVLDEAGVRHLAWLPGARRDVPELLRTFDVFALPSQAEGTSCTLQEAMSTGCAVLATSVGGTPDLITHEVDGLLVPSDDEAGMTRLLLRLHDDPLFAQRLGQAARRRAVADFSIDTMIDSYASLFEGGKAFKPA